MPTCSFCNSNDEERTYIEGNNAHICSECIKLMHDFVTVRGVKTLEDLESLESGTNEDTEDMNKDLRTPDTESVEYRMSSLMMWLNDDTWFPDGESGQFTLPDGSEVSTTQENIEDALLFLEIYDEMTCHRINEFDGIEFTETEDISELLNNEGNLLSFTYDFDLSSVAKSATTVDKYGSVGKHVVVKIIQFGEGNEAGCRVDIDSDIDRDWLNSWISNIHEEGWKVEP